MEEGQDKEVNLYPAFGERNENALTGRGESPYLAVDTASVKFSQPGYMESMSDNKDDGYTYETVVDNTKEQVAAKSLLSRKSNRKKKFTFTEDDENT